MVTILAAKVIYSPLSPRLCSLQSLRSDLKRRETREDTTVKSSCGAGGCSWIIWKAAGASAEHIRKLYETVPGLFRINRDLFSPAPRHADGLENLAWNMYPRSPQTWLAAKSPNKIAIGCYRDFKGKQRKIIKQDMGFSWIFH